MDILGGSQAEEEEDALELFLREGGTFAMLKGISQDSLDQMYSLAFNHYQVGKWREAHTLFQGLCALDHYDTRFFLGLGACRQQLGMFQAAIESYTYGALIDIKDPRFPFYAGECQLQLDDLEAAESGFYSAGLLASADAKYSALARRAEGMLEAVSLRSIER
ncbi:SycD/LcrH family type III secretion system chaperone [Pseudomonas plecoglossicida]|uniref:CesD/SycD/LcrH family type III secretion system chaperone n=1 Tax=Pseudomonas plecoglossicida TaxID=70775 RepID=A0AAD0VRW9_PSEDL|nr:SycD/LcrH family type III secretion system chaperone [Pseudomonas plecoglossicida]AXM95534.1 CesD/SycD/LcrH family type III secretion system chaperone [Pseudomonas plecoglossicida]EPB94339.1 regulatory protein PcrH [Pseudomonas plecoglossicida NB2011]QLB56281.1 SycD/LcrH family type III secretion system chaperone [Pseudomonas plecoglossicida]GLR37892.1 CesD/SycD/LcrH family type III secretion system chaperone [Pseudomonas plecoglossicida]